MSCLGKNMSHFQWKKPFQIKMQKGTLYGERQNFDSEDEFWLAYVEAELNSKIIASMRVNNCDVKFQIDTGAEINTICQKYVKKMQVRKQKKQN